MPDDSLKVLLQGISGLARRIGVWSDFLSMFRDACGQFDLLIKHVRDTVDRSKNPFTLSNDAWGVVDARVEEISNDHLTKLAEFADDLKNPIHSPTEQVPDSRLTPGDLLAALQAELTKIEAARVSAPQLFEVSNKAFWAIKRQQTRCAEQIKKESAKLVDLVVLLEGKLPPPDPAPPK